MYILEKVSNNSFMLSTDGTATNVKLQVQKLIHSTYIYATIEPTIVASDGGVVSYASPYSTVTDNATSGYTYVITMSDDGVYKITVDLAVDNVYLFISTATLYSALSGHIQNVICCNPEEACNCNEDCKDYYNYNVLAILSQCYFGLDIDINFNYGIIGGAATDLFTTTYTYKCVKVDTGAAHWDNSTSIVLLQNYDTSLVGDTDTVILNNKYICIHTGIPDDYDSGEFTALTDELVSLLTYISDAIYRVDEYLNSECETSNDICSC